METGRRKRKGWIKELRDGLQDYFSATTVHGFQYIAEGRNVFERSFWIVFIILGFSYGGYQIYSALSYWDEHPLQTTIDEIGLPVHELQFPAITVCDTESLKMPRRNRWMFVEQLLNGLELSDPEQEAKNMLSGFQCIIREPFYFKSNLFMNH